jgi:Tfp pilus assembly protein PilF
MRGDNYLRAAYAYLYIHDFNRASEAFQRAIDTNPDNPEYHFHASVTAVRNGDLEAAWHSAREAVRIAPEEPFYRMHLAFVGSKRLHSWGRRAMAAGDTELAILLLSAAVQADPLNEEAASELAAVAGPLAADSGSETSTQSDE